MLVSRHRNFVAEKYRGVFDTRSTGELALLAQVKRFLERYNADPQFRNQLADAALNPASVAQAYGIELDPSVVLPLFRTELTRYRFTPQIARWPLARMWDDFVHDLIEVRDAYRENGDCAVTNPRFHSWRQRQIRRCDNEFGALGPSIVHSVLAVELSSGCSIGCWFCGVSADNFRGNFGYTAENGQFWRAVLDVVVEIFGSAAQTGFCYWATDPFDNPDYPLFIEDYYRITGHLPQTTTAAPLKDLAFTRRIMTLHEQYRCILNRFSILNLKTLNMVHAVFSADELLPVELVNQSRDALGPKAIAGRALDRQKRFRAVDGAAHTAAFETGYSTIACVSGFLVNMVERTVRLISPTHASERWKLGYIVFGERRFETPASFRGALEDLIAEHMPAEPDVA